MNLDYVAGLFDGEGHIIAKEYRNGEGDPSFTVEIGISNTDIDALREVQSFLGIGKVYVSQRPGRKAIGQFRIRHWRDCLRVAKQLLPRTRIKRANLGRLIHAIEGRAWVAGDTKAITKEKLEGLYCVKGFGVERIAPLLDVSPHTVARYVRKFGIPVRHLTPWQPTRVELYHLYHEAKLSVADIAKQVGRDYATVLYHMRALNIPRRTDSEALRLKYSSGWHGASRIFAKANPAARASVDQRDQ
jgi:hypothetical protein